MPWYSSRSAGIVRFVQGGVVKTFRCADENRLMFGPLAKRYEGIEIHDPPQDGDVQFVFHTYHGFVVVMMQTEHRISCSPDDARELLSRFHRFNLCWGLLGPGLVYVPFLTFGNYFAQRRSITNQERALAETYP